MKFVGNWALEHKIKEHILSMYYLPICNKLCEIALLDCYSLDVSFTMP